VSTARSRRSAQRRRTGSFANPEHGRRVPLASGWSRHAHVFLSARENAQRCAVDRAPYVHAKLQAVHHEHGPTGRYIISDRPMTEEEWIRERATVIDVTPET
jgi:hypothetical protein